MSLFCDVLILAGVNLAPGLILFGRFRGSQRFRCLKHLAVRVVKKDFRFEQKRQMDKLRVFGNSLLVGILFESVVRKLFCLGLRVTTLDV